MDEYKNLVNQKTSALSSLGNANRQALKYADNTALAQGYATQGARLQNMGNLQNAYLNQVGGVNQQFQQQLGSLENTASKEALNNYQVNVENAIANNTLTNEELSKLQNAYFGRLSSTDITEAENYTRQALGLLNQTNQTSGTIDDSTKNTTFTTSNGEKYVSNLSSKSNGGKGKNFKVTIGTKEYKMELGDKVVDANIDSSKIEVGQIVEYKNENGTFLITKDPKGKIRYVAMRDGRIGVEKDSYEDYKNKGWDSTAKFYENFINNSN